jgi:predicted nucleic acid-binding protein
MAKTYIDTSAILALFVSTDVSHQEAKRLFEHLRSQAAGLVTTSYVLLETYALLGRRLGLAAVRAFREDFSPLLEIVWVDRNLHERGLDLLLARSLRDLSLVDAISFLVIQEERIADVFAFDGHFDQQGFRRPGSDS